MELLFIGFAAGFAHVISGADHLAALAPFAARHEQRGDAEVEPRRRVDRAVLNGLPGQIEPTHGRIDRVRIT
jgi:hypothetical protein